MIDRRDNLIEGGPVDVQPRRPLRLPSNLWAKSRELLTAVRGYDC